MSEPDAIERAVQVLESVVPSFPAWIHITCKADGKTTLRIAAMKGVERMEREFYHRKAATK